MTICPLCNKSFKSPQQMGRHKKQSCPNNPNPIPAKQPIKRAKPKPNTILSQTRQYIVLTKTVSQILNKLKLNLHYDIYDSSTEQIYQLRACVPWLKLQQLNKPITLLEYQTEKICIHNPQ